MHGRIASCRDIAIARTGTSVRDPYGRKRIRRDRRAAKTGWTEIDVRGGTVVVRPAKESTLPFADRSVATAKRMARLEANYRAAQAKP